MKNVFFDFVNIDKAKTLCQNCPRGEVVILIPHYSINVQMKYRNSEQPEVIDYDWDEFENELGYFICVNDYDDLVADPHGILYL